MYANLDPLQQSDLLAYLLDCVEVEDQELRIALLGQVPETGRLDDLTSGTGQYRQPSSWLRRLKARGTPVEDRIVLAEPPESTRQRRLRVRGERMEALMAGPPPAAEALRKAMVWQGEIEVGATTVRGSPAGRKSPEPE